MNKKYLQAKKQGLNWQALLIEETQTELKILIRDMVLQKKTFSEINKVVVKTIEKAVNDLESDNLKEFWRLLFFHPGKKFIRLFYKNLLVLQEHF